MHKETLCLEFSSTMHNDKFIPGIKIELTFIGSSLRARNYSKHFTYSLYRYLLRFNTLQALVQVLEI